MKDILEELVYDGNIGMYHSKEEFDARKDKSLNGVSIDFLVDNDIKMGELHLVNCKGCWNSIRCVPSVNLVNCTEVHFSSYCSDSYFSHDCHYCNNIEGVIGMKNAQNVKKPDGERLRLAFSQLDDLLIL